MSELVLVGCSGWNYGDTPEKGGWTDVFYPDKNTKRLRYYSEFFNTAEMLIYPIGFIGYLSLLPDSHIRSTCSSLACYVFFLTAPKSNV